MKVFLELTDEEARKVEQCQDGQVVILTQTEYEKLLEKANSKPQEVVKEATD